MGREGLQIERLTGIGAESDALIAEASALGFPMMERLRREWLDGTNRFDLPGEILLAAWVDGHLVAIGGLNRDPYADDSSLGRVRHLYVLADYRERGIGRALVRRIAAEARAYFVVLRLRTATAQGARFYEELGFVRAEGEAVTHIMRLPPEY